MSEFRSDDSKSRSLIARQHIQVSVRGSRQKYLNAAGTTVKGSSYLCGAGTEIKKNEYPVAPRNSTQLN